jgi:hypothetical protein
MQPNEAPARRDLSSPRGMQLASSGGLVVGLTLSSGQHGPYLPVGNVSIMLGGGRTS